MRFTYFFLIAGPFLSMLISGVSAWEDFETGFFCAKVNGQMEPLSALKFIHPRLHHLSVLTYGDPYVRPTKFSYMGETFESTDGINPGQAGFFQGSLVVGPKVKGETFFVDDQLEVLHTFYSCPTYNSKMRVIATVKIHNACFEVPVYFRPLNDPKRIYM